MTSTGRRPRTPLALHMTEAQFTETVIALAKLHGWMVAHFRPAWDRGRWTTPMSGDKGFPDLCLARDGQVVFAELKSQVGRVRSEQDDWLKAIRGRPPITRAYVWRPSDLDHIREVLQ